MKVLAQVLREFFGLFIEEGSLVIGIGAWLGVAFVVFKMTDLYSRARSPLLFLGLAVLLIENIHRTSRS